MAKLSTFRIDSKAKESGEWQSLGEEFGGIEVLIRGIVDEYSNAISAKMRAAAKPYNGDGRKIPAEVSTRITIEVVCDKLLLGVRGVEGEDGEPMTLDAFKRHMADPDFVDVVNAVVAAAYRVGIVRKDTMQAAAGNSDAPFATT